MGPRRWGRGNETVRVIRVDVDGLQWGRVCRDAEIRPHRVAVGAIVGASMGPRPRGRGDEIGYANMRGNVPL